MLHHIGITKPVLFLSELTVSIGVLSVMQVGARSRIFQSRKGGDKVPLLPALLPKKCKKSILLYQTKNDTSWDLDNLSREVTSNQIFRGPVW